MKIKGLTVKDGKFYQDDVHVPIEHGNKEQIKLLNRVQGLLNDGEIPTVREVRHIEVVHRCPCGAIFEFTDLELDEDDPLDMLAGNVQSCHNCNTQYKLACDGDGDLIIKMLPNKKATV